MAEEYTRQCKVDVRFRPSDKCEGVTGGALWSISFAFLFLLAHVTTTSSQVWELFSVWRLLPANVASV